MIVEYIKAAMRKAHYERLDDGTFYGEINGFNGVYSNEASLEECRDELDFTLEDCIFFSTSKKP